MKIAMTLLEQKRKKKSSVVMFELEKKQEKLGKPQITALARKLSGKNSG